jgi:hypothetical protein
MRTRSEWGIPAKMMVDASPTSTMSSRAAIF